MKNSKKGDDMNRLHIGGYLFWSEAAVQAAEWLHWVGTREELRMATDMIEGNFALAVDFAINLPMQWKEAIPILKRLSKATTGSGLYLCRMIRMR